jgi:DNA-binding NtrC family response regulator
VLFSLFRGLEYLAAIFDTHHLKALTIYLELTGIQVEQARCYEGLQKLDQNTFHIVVSDIRMQE